jgi:hypothetical protein
MARREPLIVESGAVKRKIRLQLGKGFRGCPEVACPVIRRVNGKMATSPARGVKEQSENGLD